MGTRLLLPLLILSFVISACAQNKDDAHLAICTSLASAVTYGEAKIAVRGVEFPEDDRPIIRVDFWAERGGAEDRNWVYCAFKSAGYQNPDSLYKLETQDGEITGARLWAIKRFWLTDFELVADSLSETQWEGDLQSRAVTIDVFGSDWLKRLTGSQLIADGIRYFFALVAILLLFGFLFKTPMWRR